MLQINWLPGSYRNSLAFFYCNQRALVLFLQLRVTQKVLQLPFFFFSFFFLSDAIFGRAGKSYLYIFLILLL